MVRAKFRCIEVGKKYSHTGEDGKDVFHTNVRLLPVFCNKRGGYDPPEENKAFYAATPSGEIVLSVVSEAAGSQFDPGKSYYVDFTPAED
jgi:hypothetical protein